MRANGRVLMLIAVLVLAQPVRVWACASTSLFDGRRQDAGATVREVQASISTYPSLPNLHGGDFSCVWCMIQTAPSSPQLLHAQVGYTREDGDNSLKILAQYTDEAGILHTTFVSTLDGASVPGSGAHTYRCEQDSITGRWTFYYDGQVVEESPADLDTDWEGTQVFFSGEVKPDADVQMMGDANNKVRLSSLKYRKDTETSLQGIWPAILVNGSPNQWGQDVNQGGGYFDIFDRTP